MTGAFGYAYNESSSGRCVESNSDARKDWYRHKRFTVLGSRMRTLASHPNDTTLKVAEALATKLARGGHCFE